MIVSYSALARNWSILHCISFYRKKVMAQFKKRKVIAHDILVCEKMTIYLSASLQIIFVSKRA